jgi:RNA polymerase sigma-70 factor (ECF subfamily)
MGKVQEKEITVSDLVHQFSDDLFRFAFSKTKNKVVSEDLVQDTFIVAVTKLDTFRGESSHKTWLISILRNKISDYYRKKSRDNISDKELDDQSFSFNSRGSWNKEGMPFVFEDSEHLLDNPEFTSVFSECIEDLPPLWSSVVKMKYINPVKSKEICKELEITDTNLWQIVHRSKLKLKDCLDGNWIKKGN